MSQLDKFEFKDFIPIELYKKYFDVMIADEIVYICIIQNESQVGSIYLERPKENADSVEGIIRVFFTLPDLHRYAKSVSSVEQVPFELVRRWEMKFSGLVDYVTKMDSNYKQSGKLGVRAVASAIHAEKFIDLDILWTAESHLMV
jgi:hypothetical protein